MLKLNLFYEQQQIQREKDLDPIKLTLVFSGLFVMGIMVWAAYIYISLGPLRSEVEVKQAELQKQEGDKKALGLATDLPKIQAQSDCLRDFELNRILISTQLHVLRETVPTNCQIRLFSTSREIREVEVDGKKFLTHKMDFFIEANAQSKDKVELLQIRDNLIESFRLQKLNQDWVQQEFVVQEGGASNRVNSVILVSSVTKDPVQTKVGNQPLDPNYRGIFEIKLPVAIKDAPKKL